MLIISFSWAVAVDSTPQADRPYIGSSQTNSVFELAFGYNGLSRLIGQNGMGGGNRGGFADRSGRNQSGQPPEGSQFQPPTGAISPNSSRKTASFSRRGTISINRMAGSSRTIINGESLAGTTHRRGWERADWAEEARVGAVCSIPVRLGPCACSNPNCRGRSVGCFPSPSYRLPPC